MYQKTGKCLGIFNQRVDKFGKKFWELILGQFRLVIKPENEILYYACNDEKLNPIGEWITQYDGSVYLCSKKDSKFGEFVAEKRCDQLWLFDAVKLTADSKN